ncbi:MAG: ABC transporter ATP-binding protein/permease, partial [Proteobacteria bacterium]|nr:ABC transporter ATP-binding protein/permease [Pseudomonadota bacterium]
MRVIALLVAALSLIGSGSSFLSETPSVPLYVGITGFVVAAVLARSSTMGSFLRYFVGFYGVSFAVLALLQLLQPLLPAHIAGYVPPPLTTFTAGAFVLFVYALSRVPVIQKVATIADPYFNAGERRDFDLPLIGKIGGREGVIAMSMLTILLLINLGQVAISVQLSYWSRNWFDAIQNKNAAEFWRLLFAIWVPWVAVLITTNLIEYVIDNTLKIRWRAYMTERLTGRWLDDGTHYRLNISGNVIDNPDQRIQEDVNKYIFTTYSLSITLIQQISSLISFAVILWGLSASLTLPGTTTTIPGLLLWIAILYAALGTAVTHLIGRRLIPLYFEQEKYEANFRFGLARLREFSEPIALLNGEETEQRRLNALFANLIANFFRIVHVRKWLNGFVQLYGSANSVVPFLIVAPFYFAGTVTLGAMQQTAGAFARVDGALSFFIDRYATLADFKAVVDRLTGFEASIAAAKKIAATSGIEQQPGPADRIAIPSLDLVLPDGTLLVRVRDLILKAGEHVLIVGPSGSGKSTIFRAIAAIWPFGTGRIERPAHELMVLPQRPYLPNGTLRGAVSYPEPRDAYDDAAIIAALEAVRLGHLAKRLDEVGHWTQMLSGGEQQRLGVARVLLSKPAWLLLDESTSALDEPLEGLAPLIVQDLLGIIGRMVASGDVGVILVEQHAH